MDVDPSDFLAHPRPPRPGPGGSALLRKSWVLLLPFVVFVPLGISLLKSPSPPKEKSFSQAAREEPQAPALPNPHRDSAAQAGKRDSGSAPAAQDAAGQGERVADRGSAAPEQPGAAKPEAAPTAPAASSIRYRVRSGDTLSAIALRSKVSSASIREANRLPAEGTIFAGQLLVIPDVSKDKVAALLNQGKQPVAAVPPAQTTPTAGAKPAASPGNASPSSPAPAPRRSVVLGPPAPKPDVSRQPLAVSGLPAPVAPPPAGTRHSGHPCPPPPQPQRRVVLGPPVFPVPGTAYSPQRGTVPESSAPVQVHAAAVLEADPGPSQTQAGGQPMPVSAAGGGLISYVVQPFDTLSSIAKAHATTPETILSLNRIGSLREGQTILLPITQNKVAAPTVR